MRLFFFILCYVFCVASGGDNEGEIESHRKKLLDQLTRTRTVLREGYDLVTRQISTDIFMFRSFRSVSVIHYPISRDVTDACFTFQSEEIHLNTIGRFFNTAQVFFNLLTSLCMFFILLITFSILKCNYQNISDQIQYLYF